ncbi:MAG: CreA family protein [Alphaproteobacteria bacterium]|nr:CreA family protein [Alphaproteobacteria bacterium]
MRSAALLSLALLATTPAAAEVVGTVDTAFKLIGPDHKIVVERFLDPKVQGVACHLSRAVAGGISGALGLAEDTSDASIACRQVGPITLPDKPLPDGDEVFGVRTSVLFKRMHVVRFHDKGVNTLVYLVYSDKLVDGSPKNAISTVPIMPWR